MLLKLQDNTIARTVGISLLAAYLVFGVGGFVVRSAIVSKANASRAERLADLNEQYSSIAKKWEGASTASSDWRGVQRDMQALQARIKAESKPRKAPSVLPLLITGIALAGVFIGAVKFAQFAAAHEVLPDEDSIKPPPPDELDP